MKRLDAIRGVLALLAAAAALPAGAAESFPGMALLARAESILEARRDELRENLGHYGLVFPIEPGDLERFLTPIGAHPDGEGYVLGTAWGAEGHAGGLLRLLFEHWRPQGRRAEAGDRYRFRGNGVELELGRLYAGYRQQIFLPEGGELPRMRFAYTTASAGEQTLVTDAYAVLALLLAREADPTATWTNFRGESLSVERLLQRAWQHFLTDRDASRMLADHTNLHLVELLLAYDRRSGGSLGADRIQRRFLEVALERDLPAGRPARELLAHDLESLGLLLADPRVSWSPEARRRVARWLRRVEEEDLRDVEALEILHLAHAVKGLRGVRDERAKLE